MRRTLLTTVILAGLALLAPTAHAEDCLDRLAQGIERFRGIGYPSVKSYQVEVLLPDDPEEESVPLHELWRAPRSLVIRAVKPGTHRAIVRSLALYLEPLYVARTSLLDADWQGYAERVRAESRIHCSEEEPFELIAVSLPDAGIESSAGLPPVFEDLREFTGRLDSFGRLASLQVAFRDGSGYETLTLDCEYDEDGFRPQPDLALWTLPSGELVEIRTTFREETGRILPDTRTIMFPSRYDPGDTEEIFVRYANYDIDIDLAEELFAGPDAFRYDANGLVAD